MVRNIVMVVVVCLLLGLVVYEVRKHQEKVRQDSGAFTCQGCLSPTEKERYDKEDHGETTDGNSERKAASARVAAEQAAAGTSSTGTAGTSSSATGGTTSTPSTEADAFSNKGAGTSSMVPPAQGTYGTGNQPAVVATTGQPGAVPVGVPSSLPAGMPATDSQAANAPNGMRFGGSGSYQWYRQGNLTWRVDTSSGRSCIVYATMEEWRKPIVMSHGCGGNA